MTRKKILFTKMKKISSAISSVKRISKNFIIKAKYEVWETKEASIIVSKYIKHEQVTKTERKFMFVQIFDVCKIIFIGVPFAIIPGASIILPFVIKGASKIGVNLLPSNFKGKSEDIKEHKF